MDKVALRKISAVGSMSDSNPAVSTTILLSGRDFKQFVDAIENPESPNDRLKAAAQEYKATRRQHPEADR